MSWTDEKEAELRRLHAEGKSYSEIGAAIGVSRNAAIGKAKRLGLAGRNSHQPRARESHVRRRSATRIAYIKAQTGKPRLPFIVKPPEEVSKKPVKFSDLAPTHCRWVLSGDGINTLFCGDEIHSRSYCIHHFVRCYIPARHMTESEKEYTARRFQWAEKPIDSAPPLAPEEMVA
jgi:hypothetical protein